MPPAIRDMNTTLVAGPIRGIILNVLVKKSPIPSKRERSGIAMYF
jgi:hypothetical protein